MYFEILGARQMHVQRRTVYQRANTAEQRDSVLSKWSAKQRDIAGIHLLQPEQ